MGSTIVCEGRSSSILSDYLFNLPKGSCSVLYIDVCSWAVLRRQAVFFDDRLSGNGASPAFAKLLDDDSSKIFA